MAIRIDTNRYEGTHGHIPRQPRQYRTSSWAFQIDSDPTPVCITASYKEAVKQAKALAQFSVTVLP